MNYKPLSVIRSELNPGGNMELQQKLIEKETELRNLKIEFMEIKNQLNHVKYLTCDKVQSIELESTKRAYTQVLMKNGEVISENKKLKLEINDLQKMNRNLKTLLLPTNLPSQIFKKENESWTSK